MDGSLNSRGCRERPPLRPAHLPRCGCRRVSKKRRDLHWSVWAGSNCGGFWCGRCPSVPPAGQEWNCSLPMSGRGRIVSFPRRMVPISWPGGLPYACLQRNWPVSIRRRWRPTTAAPLFGAGNADHGWPGYRRRWLVGFDDDLAAAA